MEPTPISGVIDAGELDVPCQDGRGKAKFDLLRVLRLVFQSPVCGKAPRAVLGRCGELNLEVPCCPVKASLKEGVPEGDRRQDLGLPHVNDESDFGLPERAQVVAAVGVGGDAYVAPVD